MKKQSVAAGIIKNLLDYSEQRGADRVAILNQVGLSEEDLVDQDARIPLDSYKTVLRACKLATGEPALPMVYTIDTRLEDISIVGLIIHSSSSMADSMTQLNRYSRLMVEVDVMEAGERFSVVPEGTDIWIVDNRPEPNSFFELTEVAFARFIGEFRRHFPDQPFALAIEVTHPAPGHADRYKEILQCDVTFDAPRNALQMDPVWLTTEWDVDQSYVFGIFTEKADALLAELEAEDSIRARIESLLLPLLHTGELSADSVAEALGMSRQTLYRRLKDEGVTFANVVDDLRLRMATDYLNARKVSVNETAYLVGFSEASSFVRAFRRWTGQTPAEFRKASA